MKNSHYFDSQKLRRLLLNKDRQIANIFPDEIFNVVLVGGAALMLFKSNDKMTNDIDVFSTSDRKIDKYLFDAVFNDRVKNTSDSFSSDYIDRIIPLDEINVNTICLKYYLLSLEDVVASKLYAGRDKDKMDLKNANLKDMIDWSVLDRIVYEEMERDSLNERRWKELVCTYERYKEVINLEDDI